MIGNKIYYIQYKNQEDHTGKLQEGLVVDSWTNVSGSVSGRTDVSFGFGEGRVYGSTKSARMYKVQYDFHGTAYFEDIHSFQVKKIIEFAKLVVIDEKIIQQA